MFFTVEHDKRPGMLPSRITVHNTPIGKCKILLIGIGKSTTYFASKGTTHGPKKHRWEVQVSSGGVVVLWDGKMVPPGQEPPPARSR
jgi:hypothetical protein